MAEASYVQSSFLGGEWSKAAQGRIDDKDYRTALNKCLNGIPMESGAWTRRPGSKHGMMTRGGAAGRIISLPLQETTPYTIEFTDGHMRFRTGTDLVMTNDANTVASISTANPAVIETSTAHGWSSGDAIIFDFLSTTLCPLLQNRVFTATVTDTTHFSIADAITGDAIDGSTLGWSTPGTLPNVTRILDISSPYTNTAWQTVRSVQTETQAVLLHPTTATRVLDVDTLPASGTFAEFTLSEATFKDGPYYDPIEGGALITPSGLSGNITLTVSFPTYDSAKVYSIGDFALYSAVNYRSLTNLNVGNQPDTNPSDWEAVSAGVAVGADGFTGSDVGRMIRLFSEPPLWATATNYSAGNVVEFNGSYWTALKSMTGATPTTGNINPNQPGNLSDTWAVNAAGAVWTWGKITGLGNQISQSLSGAANIGNMTETGGLAAAFDDVTAQTFSASATASAVVPASNYLTRYVGRDFSSASDQQIASVTIYPTSDQGFWNVAGPYGRLKLYGSATLPTAYDDGTLLGDTGFISDTSAAITITSSDQSTAWKYVWVAYLVFNTSGVGQGLTCGCAELQMFGPTGTGTSNTAVTAQILGDNLKYTSAVRTWRLGLYSDTTGYPRCGTYHEGRLWIAGSIGNRVDASRSSDIFNFAPTEPDGTVSDSNAISAVFRAPDVNTIFWMVPDHLGIVVGTQAGEWLVQASALNNPLTPTSIQVHRVTTNGCANIEPRRSALTITFVQAFKHKLMEYFSDVFSGRFTSPNLSEKAKHLTTRGIEEIAYQNELVPIVWARCTDGSLIGMTYKRESLFSSQGPTFNGWHQHTLGSGRTVTSICTGPSTDGLLDALSMITYDSTSGLYHFEQLTNFWEEGGDITTAWHCDNAVAPSSYEVSTVGGADFLVINGLWHLNGESVAVFAGGVDAGDYTVSSGTVTIPLPAATLLTSSYIDTFAGSMPIVVGFTYTSDGQLVRPATQQETRSVTGPGFGKTRRTDTISALLVDVQGISFGTRFDSGKLNAAQFKTPGGTAYTKLQLYSGIYWRELTDTQSRDSMLCWRITRPYPATIAAMSGYGETQES